MTEKQKAALEEAKQRHYIIASSWGKSNTALYNAYWEYCKSVPWHPFIRVTAGPRYASVWLDADCVHDDSGSYVIGVRDSAHEPIWQCFKALFEETQDRWRRDGIIVSGGFARGVPVDLVPRLIASLWLIVSQPDAYIY